MHVSGFHRTYVGQTERGEKNISFANVQKLSGVFGVTMAELLMGLETGSPDGQSAPGPVHGSRKVEATDHLLFEIQQVARLLRVQHAAMERTVSALEVIAGRYRWPAG